MLWSRKYAGIKEQQDSHETLSHPKREKKENGKRKITNKLQNIKVADEINRSQSEKIKNLTGKKHIPKIKKLTE